MIKITKKFLIYNENLASGIAHMLFTTLHIPNVYEVHSDDAEMMNLTCSLLLKVLEDMNRNCLILDDNSNAIRQHISGAIDKWPPKALVRAQKLFKNLEANNRIIPYSCSKKEFALSCTSPSCRTVFGLASEDLIKQNVRMSLGVNGCLTCSSLPKASELQYYSMSALNDERRQGERVILTKPSLHGKANFEKNIWEPLFKFAKKVQIVDRNIGLYVDHENGNYRVSDNYQRTLRWIFEKFLDSQRQNPVSVFEICCAVIKRPNIPDPGAAARAIVNWVEQDIVREFNAHMNVTVKIEKKNSCAHMMHARYLFTDQITLHIERGADLLINDTDVRDVTINIIEDANEVVKELGELRDEEKSIDRYVSGEEIDPPATSRTHK